MGSRSDEEVEIVEYEEEIEIVDEGPGLVLEAGTSQKGEKKKKYSINFKHSCIDFLRDKSMSM